MVIFNKAFSERKVLKNNKISTVIFDLDGTLIDSKAGIVNGLKNAFESCGLKVPQDKNIPIGPPLRDTIINIFPNISEEMIKKITESFTNACHKFDLPVSKPFSNVVELLKTLKNMGIKTFVATYKPKIFSQKILEKYFYGLYVDIITPTELPCWISIYNNNCTKTDIVEFLIKKHSINPELCAMVGDAISDIEAAHKNGLISIAAKYGYGENLNFAQYFANTTDELCNIILSLTESQQYQEKAV